MDASRLDPATRASDLEHARSDAFDLVVIGGGVVGAGTALDAASRGLSVALIEQRDWASGTSSRSSKLIHGGLRYLEHLEFGLVREALREGGPGKDVVETGGEGLFLQVLAGHVEVTHHRHPGRRLGLLQASHRFERGHLQREVDDDDDRRAWLESKGNLAEI